MLRTLWITGIATALAVVATPARAHDRELGYILGGALVGAAIGGIVYDSRYHPRHHHYVGHYAYAPGVYYYPPAYRVRHIHAHGRHHGQRHYRRHHHGVRHHRH